MKLNKYLLGAGVMLSTSAISSTFDSGDALKYLYDAYFNKTSNMNIWPIDGGWEAPQYPTPYTKYFKDDPKFVEAGTYLQEPTISLQQISSWTDYHVHTCPDTGAWQEMPITNSAQGYTSYQTFGNKNVSVKKITVNQNVPFRFKSKVHGGLTDLLSDSFYFWSFGDGMRRFNKKGDDYDTDYTYPFLGTYYLSSIVYSEEWSIGIQISGGLNGDFSINDTRVKQLINKNGSIYLEGCDVAQVTVVPNNTPNASGYAREGTSSPSRTSYYFKGRNSNDPDGNPLTYTWTYGGITKTGETATFSFPTPVFGANSYTVGLTVTDGDKSDTTNVAVNVGPYCYSCNGQQIP
jgi:hypothetical protein